MKIIHWTLLSALTLAMPSFHLAAQTAGPVVPDDAPVAATQNTDEASRKKAAAAGLADQMNPFGDSEYRPEIGQDGKDVIWIPTPDVLVHAMLSTAGVTASDYVVDLGSGDGKIAIVAARRFGARAKGIEYNPQMVALARRNATRANVADKVSFEQADIFTADFSDATVVTLYLLPNLNLKLRPTLLNMRPGTRIVSNSYMMGDWEPDRIINTASATGYYWIVPADIAGRWAFRISDARFVARIDQSYQHINIRGGGPILDARLEGDRILLSLADGRELRGKIDGDRISGTGWSAERQNDAD